MMKKIIRYLKIIFFSLTTSEIFRSFINRRHINSFNSNKKNILKSDSLYLKKISDLGYSNCKLKDFFNSYQIKTINEKALKVKNRLSIAKKESKFASISNKNYLIRLLDIDQYIDFDDLLVQSVLKGRIHNIARNYLRQDVKITNIDYWLNFVNPDNKLPIASQQWHRDYEDKQLLKIFVYFTDVEEVNGPLSFICKTHFGGIHNSTFKARPPFGIVISNEKIKKTFDENDIKIFKMKKEEIIFSDTTGFHKGGHCLTGERFVFTATFTTFAGISKRNFKFKKNSLAKYPSYSVKALSD
jgi:hypothetical protein